MSASSAASDAILQVAWVAAQVSLAGTAAYALSRNPMKGWSLFGVIAYSRLAGDFADSPLVADRGSANQVFGAAGLAYSF